MAKFVIEDFHKEALDMMTPDVMRHVRKKVLQAGAKVAEKEMRREIIDRKHVISNDMADSVVMGEIHEDVDGAWVEVYPQGYDRRGVSNEMKNMIINKGYYNTFTGRSQRQKDPYVNRMRKKLAPRILAVMEQQFDMCMTEITNGG